MSGLSNWRLRTLLYSLTGAMLIPATLLLLYNAFSQYRQAEEAAAMQAYELAQIAADSTQTFLQDAHQLLATLAARIDTDRTPNQECNPIFAEFNGLYPQFANLSQANNAGYMVCSTNGQPDNKMTYVGDMKWFTTVQAKRAFIVAPPYVGVITKRTVSVLAHPILDKNGIMQGSLQLPIDLAKFRLMPGMGKLPGSVVISLIDTTGTLIARSRDADNFVGKNYGTTEAVQQVLRMKNGTMKSQSSQGVQRIFGFVPVQGTDWYAVAGIATEAVLANARHNGVNNVVIGSVILLLVLILALYLSNQISQPILQIQETASRVASGIHDARAAIGGPAEVSQVARQFNAMLDALEHNSQERTERENEIHRLAFFDALTELPNRRLLLQSIEEAVLDAHQHKDTGAIFYIDLDRFKDVNDAHGHANGDRFLKQVADRLGILDSAKNTLARIAGDEFVIVATGLGGSHGQAFATASVIGKGLQASLRKPFLLDEQVIEISGSVGVTLFPKIGDSSHTLLQEADIAMYQAKRSGRNQVAFFEPAMRAAINDRVAMKADLKKALESNALQLHVQPQVDCDARTVGAEVLLRWTDPARGPVSPALFIPIAEESDLIIGLGKWVLEQGCRMLVEMQAAGFRIPLSINVSPRQFRSPDFVEHVRATLLATGAPPSFLIFEVTEGLLIEEMDRTIGRMHQLTELGLRFSIDDFGTGYSSLKYLKQLPLYELKIDKSFVSDTPGSARATAIVQSILGVAKHLELHVVAEGVETGPQREFLVKNGCNAMQGYLFARPMPLQQFLQRPRPSIEAPAEVL